MPFKVAPPLYNTWQNMKGRCLNPRYKQFADYGGRGITVCARWMHSYANFADDMGPRPEGLTLDRIDNDRGYEPGNCRWAPRSEQQRNQRCTVRVIVDGAQYRAADLAERAGLKTDTIIGRAASGLTLTELMDPARRTYLAGLALGGRASGAKQQARTHCQNGHAFTPENTSITKEGWRRCLTCHRQRQAVINARRRA